MFTGIVEDTGIVSDVQRANGVLAVRVRSDLFEDMVVGGSISVNGACLTAVSVEGNSISLEVVDETVSRTTLGGLDREDRVNLERPMSPQTLFDGHIVQGHVDGVGEVAALAPEGESTRITVEVPANLMRYIVDKGSIAVDGVSLTVAGVSDAGFEVAIIPHTLEVTTLGQLGVGDRVNVEVDVLAKYVERLLKN